MSIVIEAVGLRDLKKFYDLAPREATVSARVAINETAQRKGLPLARAAMAAQVNFPRGYFGEINRTGKPNFGIEYRARDNSLEAGIAGRQEPTSLSRFSPERVRFRQGRHARGTPINVTVHPGRTRELKHAFFLRLKNGNIGLGIRLKDGQSLTNTVGAKIITDGPLKGVALLYGPSVDQVFRTVAVDISPEVLDALTVEFLRQFEFRTRANL